MKVVELGKNGNFVAGAKTVSKVAFG